jgi:hypothetical protein
MAQRQRRFLGLRVLECHGKPEIAGLSGDAALVAAWSSGFVAGATYRIKAEFTTTAGRVLELLPHVRVSPLLAGGMVSPPGTVFEASVTWNVGAPLALKRNKSPPRLVGGGWGRRPGARTDRTSRPLPPTSVRPVAQARNGTETTPSPTRHRNPNPGPLR